jgi:hypothetical protein
MALPPGPKVDKLALIGVRAYPRRDTYVRVLKLGYALFILLT